MYKPQCKNIYIVTFPDGHEERVGDLPEFCKIHNLKSPSMYNVAHGRQTEHNGFKCKKALPTL